MPTKRKRRPTPKKKKSKRTRIVSPLEEYFPKRHAQFDEVFLEQDSTRGRTYKRAVRRLIAWRIAYPGKELPDTCVTWSERDFRVWAGQESSDDETVEKPDLDSMENSLLQCPKCHLHKVDHFTKQTRSADEPETIFAHCLACGYRWRQ